MKRTFTLLLSIALMLGMVACASSAKSWQEQYDLGMRYLEDGEYEEAILAFGAAIEIDSSRPEAYMGRAEAYIALGEPEKALKDYKKARRAAQNSNDDYEDLLQELEDAIDALEEQIEADPETGSDQSGSNTPVAGKDERGEGTVTDAYAIRFTTPYDYETCCHIPQINLENGLATKINAKIHDELYPYAEARSHSIAYTWGTKGDYLSVLVERNFIEWEWMEFHVYTISRKTGETVSTEDLLTAYGLTREGYDSMAYAMLEKMVEGMLRNQTELSDEERELYQSIREKTLSDENIRQTVPFIGENGNLCMVALLYSPAGAERYYGIYDLTAGERMDLLSCDGDHDSLEAGTGRVAVIDAESSQFSSGNSTFCGHIPRILLENDLAEQINQEIYDDLAAALEGQMDRIAYIWGVKGDYLSVVVAKDHIDWDWTDYYVYTISVKTGKTISDGELLAAYGLERQGYEAKAYAMLEKMVDELAPILENGDDLQKEVYKSVRENTLSDENIQQTIPFIGENGNLCMVAKKYSPAGAGFYYGIYDLTAVERLDTPSCDGNHGTHTLAEATRLAAQWYNDNVGGYESGYFMANEGESYLDNGKCYVAVRFVDTSPDYTGEAQTLFALVYVDMNTGEMWDVDRNTSRGYLW